MEISPIMRCPVTRNWKQRHPGPKDTAVFQDYKWAYEVASGIANIRPDHMYMPVKNSKGSGYVVIPCKPDRVDTCDYAAPLTEEQLEKISPWGMKQWQNTKDKKRSEERIAKEWDRACMNRKWK